MFFGFNEVKKRLIDLFNNNKLHHCNLLYGTKGIGKSSFIINEIAPIILNNGNIENTRNLILSEGHTDFILLNINSLDEDGKENTSKKGEINVSQTRKVINNIRMTPSISKYKLLVIDSIDDLNVNAQNVLLKTLEEPPKNTFIFLICHNMDKTIETIRSRSNIIKIPNLNIEDWSRAVFEQEENYNLSDDEIIDLYNLSNMSVAFAINILKNDSLNFYDTILDIIINKDAIQIQDFTQLINDNEKYKILISFLNKFFSDLIHYNFDNNFYSNKNNKFDNILQKIPISNILKQYDNFINLVNDIDIYNLDKKLSFNVFFNNFL